MRKAKHVSVMIFLLRDCDCEKIIRSALPRCSSFTHELEVRIQTGDVCPIILFKSIDQEIRIQCRELKNGTMNAVGDATAMEPALSNRQNCACALTIEVLCLL